MKKCRFCAEEIQEAAIKCKHCGEFLIEELRTPTPKPRHELARHLRTNFIVTAFCVVGPLALPLVWMRPDTSIAKKTAITLIVVLLTIAFLVLCCFIVKMAIASASELQKAYDQLGTY